MKLLVGFDGGRMERNTEAEDIWRRFVEVVPCPFAYDTVVGRAYPLSIDAIAMSTFVDAGHPDFRGEAFARIIVGDLFSTLESERRTLTLLHECLHLVGFTQHLRDLDRDKWTVVARLQGTLHLRSAITLADQLFEADAERMLARDFADRAARRAVYYLDQQRERVAARGWVAQPVELQPLVLLGVRLRLELASTLVREPADVEAVGELLREVDTEQHRLTAGAHGHIEPHLEALHQLLTPLRPDIADMGSWGPEAYRGAVEAALALVGVRIAPD